MEPNKTDEVKTCKKELKVNANGEVQISMTYPPAIASKLWYQVENMPTDGVKKMTMREFLYTAAVEYMKNHPL